MPPSQIWRRERERNSLFCASCRWHEYSSAGFAYRQAHGFAARPLLLSRSARRLAVLFHFRCSLNASGVRVFFGVQHLIFPGRSSSCRERRRDETVHFNLWLKQLFVMSLALFSCDALWTSLGRTRLERYGTQGSFLTLPCILRLDCVVADPPRPD